ncbi:MAG: S49 family peptidase [Nitrososphaerota archaeon]|nr:S49 family peptidase [Candidatus Bathyarchaeota archaeon]MDW8062225.1 S49 family peptidase [Nitrososphaerota archaeon]
MEGRGVGYKRVLAFVLALVIVASLLIAIYFTYIPIGIHERCIIGLIRIEGAILYDEDAYRYLRLIEYAAINSSVKAVVVYINSPGGYADLIESIYLNILSLKEIKPVICVAQLALSGGYYIAAAADYIYVYPTSYVGNIGVIGVGPSILVPSEVIIETGPYKAVGFSRLLFPYNITEALNNFLDAVESGRNGKLKLKRDELSRGLIYIGREAVRLGLADSFGSIRDAIRLASEKAGVKEYEVIDLNTGIRYGEPLSLQGMYSNIWKNISFTMLSEVRPPPALYYVYLPPQLYVALASQYGTVRSNVTDSSGRVIVDLSHGNTASWIDLDVLSGKLVERGVSTAFIRSWKDIEGKIYNASALIVATPTIGYNDREVKVIKDYVEKGGILLLFFDPSAEYVVIPDLAYPMNTLASKFNVYFAGGYLYNQIENFGFYRNIYAYISGETDSNPLVMNVTKIALFTATHIYSSGEILAYTSNDTYSSMAEKPGRYAIAVYLRKGNGTIIAFGDLSFLQEPYCYIADNLKLIENLAFIIANNTPPARRIEKPIVQPETPKVKEIGEPKIPVGTEKEYLCIEDGEEYKVLWVKVSEREVLVIYPYATIRYHYDKEGRLTGWTADNATCIYLEPIPKPPYPLVIGKEWSWASKYSLSVYGIEHSGLVKGYFKVEDIENIKVAGTEYTSASILFKINDTIYIEGISSSSVSEGFQWICKEVGHIKEESTILYYIDNLLQTTIKRILILEEIRYEGKTLSSSKYDIGIACMLV